MTYRDLDLELDEILGATLAEGEPLEGSVGFDLEATAEIFLCELPEDLRPPVRLGAEAKLVVWERRGETWEVELVVEGERLRLGAAWNTATLVRLEDVSKLLGWRVAAGYTIEGPIVNGDGARVADRLRVEIDRETEAALARIARRRR